ncbi:MAG: GntR family transcriptional regulator [Eubacteriales bacterium]|nr:GntR family transcriptional regulator [Eubacteriales bacterium]
MGKMKAYMEVYIGIKKSIREGIHKPGTLLPTEAELEKRFQVSRITVRKAIAMLVNEGYVKTVQGKGTEILDVSTIQKLNSVTSITETLKRRGYRMSVRGMAIEEVIPPANVAETLKLSENETVYLVHRILCTDDNPLCLTENYLKKDFIPELPIYADGFVGLYSFLEEKYGVAITEAYEYVSAVNADFMESQILGVPLGTALLYSRRIGYVGHEPFEYAINKLLGDRYEFSVHMEGRQ